ncbi:MAG: prolipoprotein diacylglyceryl transferase [Anaerolineaceae bacterium]|nr:prolipoprotein diacylglyceryl transferase [Anaerolineaceae bacterium]
MFVREGFFIGNFFVHYYGILVMSGAMVAAWLSTVEARRRKLDPELVWDLLPWILVGGILGARLWFVLFPPESMIAIGIDRHYYFTHPLDAINIRQGGLQIPGGVFLGALALYLFTRKNKLNFLDWTDIIAPGLLLAHAIGRWGNFINQEIYGPPTNLPWGIFIEPAYRLPEFAGYTHFHPLFLYESLWNLLSMSIMLWVGRKYVNRIKAGDITLMYFVLYGITRFTLEFIRLDTSFVNGVNANQTMSISLAIIAAGVIIWRHMKKDPPTDPGATPIIDVDDQIETEKVEEEVTNDK